MECSNRLLAQRPEDHEQEAGADDGQQGLARHLAFVRIGAA